MADIEVGDILRIGATLTLNTLFEVTNVFHVRVTAGAPLGYAAASSDIQEYMDEIYDNIKTYLSDEVATSYLTLANLTQATTFGAFAWSPTWSGVASDSQTAAGVSAFSWARTLKPRVQIRKYWGVFTEAAVDAGNFTTTVRVACSNALTDHIQSFAGSAGLTVLGVAYNRTLETTTDAISTDTSGEPGYQRRRKRGRGS